MKGPFPTHQGNIEGELDYPTSFPKQNLKFWLWMKLFTSTFMIM